jgi:periplasmic divalent cation tolerance protein
VKQWISILLLFFFSNAMLFANDTTLEVDMIYIFWTCKDKEEAKKIIFGLLDKRLVACASILPEVESIYRWEGKIEEGKEVKVIFKTQSKCFDLICSYIIEKGSYQVPEVLQVDVAKGNPRYLSWVKEETDFEKFCQK